MSGSGDPEADLLGGLTNVSALISPHVRTRADDVALVEATGGRNVTWSELDALVDAFARGLAGFGLVAGHRVSVALVNSIDFVVCYLGCLRAGAVCVPMNPRSATGEVVRMLADSGSRVVVGDAETITTVRSAVAGLKEALVGADEELVARTVAPRIVVTAVPPIPGELALSDVLASKNGRVVSPPDVETLAVLLYTSGTSGRPRGAMLTHRALLANIGQAASIDPPAVQSDDVVLGLLPLFHVYGLNAILGQALAQGARVVLVGRFDADETLDVIVEHAISNVPVAPPVIAAWAGRADLSVKLASVRLVLSGAAPLDPELTELFAAASGTRVEQGYGLTEAAPVVSSTLGSEQRSTRTGPLLSTVGRPIPGVELEVRDTAGRVVGGGDPGEIWIRGGNLFSGYWPDGDAGPGGDGWYATGDVGMVDAAGDLTLVDRLRELVIVSGFNVYPVEVEEVIAEVDGVREAAVIGVLDEETGEAVVAFVVAADPTGSDQDLVERIRTHCEARLARFKWPGQVTVVSGLPHSANGKVAKGRLRAQARREALGLS